MLSIMPLHLSIEANAAALATAQRALTAHLEPLGLSTRDVYRVELLFEEVVMNTVLHGLGASPAGHTVEAEIEVSDAEIRLRFEDAGIAFDPTSAEVRPTRRSLDEDCLPGGLGLPLLRRFADEMAWQRVDGRNRLTLTLKRS